MERVAVVPAFALEAGVDGAGSCTGPVPCPLGGSHAKGRWTWFAVPGVWRGVVLGCPGYGGDHVYEIALCRDNGSGGGKTGDG